MVTICDRTAYAPLTIGGEGEAADVPSTLRITFDENVAYRDLFEEALIARASHRRPPVGFGMPRPLLPADEAIMEVKCAGPFPLWLVRRARRLRGVPLVVFQIRCGLSGEHAQGVVRGEAS